MLKLPKPKPNLYTFVPKPIAKILVGVFVLAILALGAGAAYTWYVNRNGPGYVESVSTEAGSVKPNELFKPTTPPPNAPVGASVQTISSPINPGNEASITVKTTPQADCTISAKYNEVASTDPGLIPKKADEYGMVSWDWFVEETVPLGKWPVQVNCGIGERTGMVIGDLVVAKPEATD